jgi:hypothetical protein
MKAITILIILFHLNTLSNQLKCNQYVEIKKDKSKMLKFSCWSDNSTKFINPDLPKESYLIHNPNQFSILDISYNLYTEIPINQICKFKNVIDINVSHNSLESLIYFKELRCFLNLSKIDLSHNRIAGSFEIRINDYIAYNLEHIDLSYNSIDYLDLLSFFDSKNQSCFPNLKTFKINNNKLRSFDLLIPLSLPSSVLYFDATFNSIKIFENKYKFLFKNKLFNHDIIASRFINLTKNQIDIDLIINKNVLIEEYNIKRSTDLEIFLNKIENIQLINTKEQIKCLCPIFDKKFIRWFYEIKTNLDKSNFIFKFKCSNFGSYLHNYDCGVKFDFILLQYDVSLNEFK